MELVLSEDTGAYAEVATALRQEFGQTVSISETTPATIEQGSGASDTVVVVALGTRALTAVLPARKVAVIASLLPREAFEAAMRAAGEREAVTAIYLDQPYGRQFDLVRAVLPGRTRVGILVSAEARARVGELKRAAISRKLSLVDESVNTTQQIYPALTKLFADSDAILATPDQGIFNNGTIHNILLATYRAKCPLFGFSPAYARAGALAALYSTPQQIALQIAGTARRTLSGNALPPPGYLNLFTVGVNQTVARSLGITVDDGARIEAKLQAMERLR